MTFEIGQIFKDEYPPDAAEWCNVNNAYIEEIEPINEGVRRFQIIAVPEPTIDELQEQIQKQLTDAVQHVLDAKAQELNYDSCLSVCSYVDTGVSKFDDEGRAFRFWRSAVWLKGYEILAEVQAGERKMPTDEELLAMLPKLEISYS